MRILVIGGAGFIGSAVVSYIQSKEHAVDIMDLKRPQEGWLPMDIRDKTLLTTDLSSYDIIMIFAAVTSQLEFQKNPEDSFSTNATGLSNVLEACKRSKVKKVLFASSAAVYGNSRKRMSEEDPYKPNNMYAASKVIGEYLVNAYIQKGYFDGVILRYFNTYGIGENAKGDYKSIISIFLEDIRTKGEVLVYGDGEQRRDFINVKDVARITFELAMKHTGTFNVGTGESFQWNTILDYLQGQGLKFRRKYIQNPIRDYQYFTEANIDKLKSVGLQAEMNIRKGIDELL
ncbi:MAG: NAD-dependent epimerase/dehydratase family protein [Candidatus Blackburnbacteria bacterium]|nr:NAD-dependent epimerase/dehydratase family protein [Candidatus Blackburnbacteria bacterium]